VDVTGVGREVWEIEFGFVCGEHELSIGVSDGDGLFGLAFVADSRFEVAAVGGAVSVGDGALGRDGITTWSR